jgi:tRNA-uridine 2-sulfurtransferase
MSRVLVAMSGGVDSSVAAALLVEQGHAVVGVTMKTFCYTGTASTGRTCCGLDGILDARRVAESLGIAHYVFDMEESFTRAVIDDFVHEYAAGRTPNPCVRCNSNTKIPDLLERARRLGCDAIATGHYARTVHDDGGDGGGDGRASHGGADGGTVRDGRASHGGADGGTVRDVRDGRGSGVRVLRGLDADKDQTYFLWGVPAEVVPYLRFPVGELTKAQVRTRARQLGLATADKPESQEICFVPDGDYAQFLGRRLGTDHAALSAGALVTSDGAVVGEHGGYGRYTVGQRKGLGGGRGRALYVLGVRAATNEVVVGSHDELYRDDVVIHDLNWLRAAPAPGETVNVQVRHRSAGVPADVTAADGARVVLRLHEPQRAITPGQSGVLYRGDELIGGGRIV